MIRSVAAAALCAIVPQAATWAQAPSPKKAEEQFKNIQTFKGVPADDLMPAMQFMSAALGVDCEFCHVDRAPEKDDKKEKKTAREMIAMTRSLNGQSFGGKPEVTCFTCHRGAEHPSATPTVLEATSSAEPAPALSGEPPSADALMAKFLAASGGAEAIGKIGARIQKGTLSGLAPQPLPIEIYGKAPGKRATVLHTPRGDSLQVFDGATGWSANAGRPPREFSGADLEGARLDADLQFPTRVASRFASLRVLSKGKIGDREAFRVAGRNEGKPPVELWIDAENGRLLRTVRYAETPLGRLPTRIDYEDYRTVDGVTIPFRWTLARPDVRYTVQIDEVRHDQPVDDAKFAKPAGGA